jgi:hypothetical protein
MIASNLMAVAAFMSMAMMFSIVNMLMRMYLSIVLMGMDMLVRGMATHRLSPPLSYQDRMLFEEL